MVLCNSCFLEHYNNHGETTEISIVILDFKNQLPFVHEEFQVPKLEVLNLIFGYFGDGGSLTLAVSMQLI